MILKVKIFDYYNPVGYYSTVPLWSLVVSQTHVSETCCTSVEYGSCSSVITLPLQSDERGSIPHSVQKLSCSMLSDASVQGISLTMKLLEAIAKVPLG